MQYELRLASFNVRNLAQAGVVFYDNLPSYTRQEYETKVNWIAQQIDESDAHIIGFQEIFSSDALQDVLSRTRHYRNAHQISIHPHLNPKEQTPNVALVSRLPLAGPALFHGIVPPQLHVTLPHNDAPIKYFSRPVIEAPIMLPNGKVIHIFVVHLKSKRPDFLPAADKVDSFQFGLASLRTLVRRGTEALGVRCLVHELLQTKTVPVIVMGDFNDSINSSSTQIITNSPYEDETLIHNYLHDCFEIQSESCLKHKEGRPLSNTPTQKIDHILVSEEFTRNTDFSLGEVKQVTYFDEHLALAQPETSDHSLVLARIQLR